jgi:RNA polymerase sigma-70 factor (ECF subfamily)
MDEDPAKRVDRFMGLLLAHQERLYRYVRMVMPHSQHVDDVLQETFLVMWQKFDDSCPAGGFYSWACRIAHLKVLEAFARNTRDVPVLDQETLEQMTADTVMEPDALANMKQFLERCLAKLPMGDRELIELRYEPGMRVDTIAAKLNRPANSVSKSLGRIRQVLWQCVDDALKAQANEDGIAQ